jgi:hypothetical protein
MIQRAPGVTCSVQVHLISNKSLLWLLGVFIGFFFFAVQGKISRHRVRFLVSIHVLLNQLFNSFNKLGFRSVSCEDCFKASEQFKVFLQGALSQPSNR